MNAGACRCGYGIGLKLWEPVVPGLPSYDARGIFGANGWRHIALYVDTYDTLVAKTIAVKQAGMVVHSALFPFGGGFFMSMVEDPDGNWFELMNRRARS